jgi:hypothetical protein
VSVDVYGLYAQVVSHAKRLGVFPSVLTHEPKSLPKETPCCAISLDRFEPIAEVSGLAATSMRVVFTVRLYRLFNEQPEDDIDKKLLDAAAKLMESYNGDIQLGDESSMGIDVLGAYGDSLKAEYGYTDIDGAMVRLVTITLPVVLADAFPQAN